MLFCLTSEVGAAAHRDRASDRLGQTGDDDQRTGGMRGRHAGDDSKRDEQAVLGAEHQLADAREPPDPRRLAEGMLGDVVRVASARASVRSAASASRRCDGPLLLLPLTSRVRARCLCARYRVRGSATDLLRKLWRS